MSSPRWGRGSGGPSAARSPSMMSTERLIPDTPESEFEQYVNNRAARTHSSRRQSLQPSIGDDVPLLLGSASRAPSGERDSDGDGDGDVELDVHQNHTHENPSHPSHSFESLHYEPDESEVWRYHEAKRHQEDGGRWWTVSRRRAAKRWLLLAVTGALTALSGMSVTISTRQLAQWKFDSVTKTLHSDAGGAVFGAYMKYCLFNLLYVAAAASCVVLEPLAAGSGIPETKCFLNGINLPRVMRIKTLVCKLIGVTFSVAGGLPCGKEGPMIHSGACIAAGMSQGKSSSMQFDVSFDKFQDFRNDGEKRDFVACGAAAGVCTAFQAPIGGVLFALEEGASHWNHALTWRTFFCSLVALTTLYVIVELLTLNTGGNLDENSMFSFGQFFSLEGQGGGANYDVWELTMFVLIGVAGGAIGALFNATNKWITVRRKRLFGFTGTISAKKRSVAKFTEAVSVALLMSTVSFVLPLLWSSHCRPVPAISRTANWTKQETDLIADLVRFRCDEGEYNEVATLFFTEQDVAIRHLFHFRELGDGELADATFSPGALALFFVAYTLMAVVTYGLAVPSGLFVPSLLSGAAFGRLCGHVLHRADSFQGTFADAGTYSLMGAVAVLGGMARMTISLTVIMLEATGDMQYVLPLMITLLAARWTGNIFNDGLYDLHIHLNGLPLLESECPRLAKQNDMCVREVMSAAIVSLKPVTTVGEAWRVVSSNKHDCFPIVRARDNLFQGTISRTRIALLFSHQAFGEPPSADVGWSRPGTPAAPGMPAGGAADAADAAVPDDIFCDTDTKLLSPLLSWSKLEAMYPRYPKLEDYPPAPAKMDMVIDLRPYINTSPYTLHESASVRRAYRLFRAMALRHLCILDHEHACVGIVTRHDLLEHHIEARLSKSHAWSAPRFAGSQPLVKGSHTPYRRRLIRKGSTISQYDFAGAPVGLDDSELAGAGDASAPLVN